MSAPQVSTTPTARDCFQFWLLCISVCFVHFCLHVHVGCIYILMDMLKVHHLYICIYTLCVGMPVCISAVQWRSRTMSWLPWRSSIALWSCWISTLAVWVIPRHHPSLFLPSLFFSSPLAISYITLEQAKCVKSSVLSYSFWIFIRSPPLLFIPCFLSSAILLYLSFLVGL